MQRGARFLIFGERSMVQHGVDEGVQNIYKINAILHIFNLSARRECTAFENVHYRIYFVDVFDALIDSMLDHGTLTKNQKTSATLHGSAPAKNGTSAALHGNAFRVFMVQLGASKSYRCDRTKHSFSNDCLKNLVLVGTHLVAAPGVITP